jgi:hypothetical protein
MLFHRLWLAGLMAIATGACNATPQVRSVGGGGPGGPGAGGAGGPAVMLIDAGGNGGNGGSGADASSMYSGGITRPCEDLECQQATCVMGNCKQASCEVGKKTIVKGRVFDPAGKVPLYNVVVYVPNAPLDPIATGPSCDRCESPVSGKPIASALTDTRGDFVLENVPAGSDIPLVLQVGKWRREVKLATVAGCAETSIDDPDLLRLPRNREEGHIPRIAVATGEADKLECLLRKMGISDSEFTPEAGPGRVNFYAGRGGTAAFAPTLNGGAAFTPVIPFWGDGANLNRYDIIILSCEGGPNPVDKTPAARQAMLEYANKGGRIFASHWHNVWLQHGPEPWPKVAEFASYPDLVNPFTADVDTSFPKGAALADWLVNVAAQAAGHLVITEGQHTVQAVNAQYSRRWIHSAATTPPSVQYLTFNTPVETAAASQCGRVVFTDIHVSSGDESGEPFPSGCKTMDLSPQEKALEFMLFDLSSCIQPDDVKPRPPIIP